MNDKELILKTLEYLRNKGFTKIRIFWDGENWDNNTQLRIYLKITDNGFVRQHIYDSWEFEITRLGHKVLLNSSKYFTEEGNFKCKYSLRNYLQKDSGWGNLWKILNLLIGFGLGILASYITHFITK